MGLQSALTTALTGLQAAETTIDVVGNNVANSQTVGFKESSVVFATQFLQTISIGSAPSSDSGGTNPRQIGLGVKVAEITPNFSQGTIEISSNPLDVAIQGDGFLVVQSGSGDLYTRNGQLKLNSNNEIVTSTGQRVLGYDVNNQFEIEETPENPVPLVIPLGEGRVSQPTSNASIAGNLNPTVVTGTTQSISESIFLGDGTIGQPQAATADPFDIGDFAESIPPDTGSITVGPGLGTSGPDATPPTVYRFVFLDSSLNESTPSTEFTTTALGAGASLLLSSIPTGPPGWNNGAVVYRQDKTDGEFYRVGTVAPGDTFDDVTLESALAVPGNELNTDLIEPGSYSYYVTFVNSANGDESRPTARIGTRSLANPGGRVRIDLSQVAAPSPEFDKIRIYRNTAADDSLFLRINASDIDAATVTSFVDQLDDEALLALGTPEVDLDGPAALDGTKLVDLVVRAGDTYTGNFFEEGTLTFQAQKDGVNFDAKTLEITADTEVLDLMNFIRQASGIDTVLVENPNADDDTPTPQIGSVSLVGGKIVITSNLGEENAIEVPLTALQLLPTGSTGTTTVPITFSETQEANGPGTSTEFVVYDSLGSGLNVRITTVLEEKNPNSTVYRWYATSGDNEPFPSAGVTTVVGDGLLTFDPNGNLLTSTSNRISVERNITASQSPLEVELDFSQVSSKDVTDPQNNPISSLNVTNQDGFPPGVLTDFVITDDGTIQGQYSNGTQRTIGQLVLARFANSGGLQQVGDSLFNIGVNSGNRIIGIPGSNGRGTLSAGAVELSNTDIGQNLIELILASTQYRGGARVITATQELLDELLALSR